MFSDLTYKKTNGRTSAATRGHVGVLANKFWKRFVLRDTNMAENILYRCRENKDVNFCMDPHMASAMSPLQSANSLSEKSESSFGPIAEVKPALRVLAHVLSPPEDDLLSPPPTFSLQGHSMPAAEGPLSPPTPQLSGQKTKPVCTSSTHQSTHRLQLAPASPRAPTLDFSGPTVASRPTEVPVQASTLSSLGMLPSTPHAKRKATARSTT